MGAKRIINKVVRFLLLAFATLALLLYLLGIIANVFGLMEMRRSDEKILALLQESGDDRAVVSSTAYEGGLISYAGIHASDARDSLAVIFVHG